MKKIDLDKTVSELTKEYPELLDILKSLGFKDITSPVAMKTVGKIMTLKKGSKIKNIDLDSVIKGLEERGYEVINKDEKEEITFNEENLDLSERESKLLSYIRRLSAGEDLKDVQDDFVENFKDVKYEEIVNAEQALIKGGVPVQEVQGLCDVHSALFHDTDISTSDNGGIKNEEGHPLNILISENRVIEVLVSIVKRSLDNKERLRFSLMNLSKIRSHYDKKDQIISTLLSSKYNITGPSDVMWGVDDEIKAEIGSILRDFDGENIEERIGLLLDRINEMIYKEENILFPLAEENFTSEEWNQIYHDYFEYGTILDNIPDWDKKEEIKIESRFEDGKVKLQTGEFTLKELESILKTMPVEISFIDKDDINKFFSDFRPKVFARPSSSLNREVYYCHPASVREMVRELLGEFKTNKRDSFTRIFERGNELIRVKYLALRDDEGNYLGAIELVEDLSEVKEYLESK